MSDTPVLRLSKGRFELGQCEEVRRLIEASKTVLVPALHKLPGLLYYHAGVDPASNTVVNASLWESLDAARQMDTLKEMLAQRPILEAAGVQFDKIANYEPSWIISGDLNLGK